MVEITARDISLFRVMSLGVANLEMIMSLLRDLFAIEISRYAIEKRLSILRADGYIISKKYTRIRKHGHKTLYSLTKKSAAVLASLGRAIEQIRYGLPADIMALHELAVTETLHAMAREWSQGLYEFKFTDSAVLKKWRKKGSLDLIQDLHLELTFNDGHKKIVHMEIDRGTITSHKMATRLQKLSGRGEFVLVLCKSDLRINGLREACAKANIYQPMFVYFALQSNFNNGGLMSTKVTNINGEAGYLKL